jgi:hypothetical protein
MAANIFIGAENVDINIKHGDPVNDSFWAVQNSDNSDYSFATGSAPTLKIYDFNGRGNTLLETTTNLTLAQPSSNDIEWSDSWADIGLDYGSYYYQIDYTDSAFDNSPAMIVSGALNVV